jgi:hypothetical protein
MAFGVTPEHYRLDLPDQVIEALITAGRLTEAEASRGPLVNRALAEVLVGWQ